jgi:hypothetical protein
MGMDCFVRSLELPKHHVLVTKNRVKIAYKVDEAPDAVYFNQHKSSRRIIVKTAEMGCKS